MNFAFSDVDKRIIIKAYLKYLRTFLVFFCLGCGSVFFINQDFLYKLFDVIKIHFELPFLHSDSIWAAIYRIFLLSSVDVLCILFIFIFAFSSFDIVIIYSVIAYNGFKSGVSTLLVLYCKYVAVEFPRSASMLTFFSASFILNLILMIYAYHSQRYVWKAFSTYKNASCHRTFVSYLSLTAFVFALIFVINAIYCLTIYLI